MRAVLHVSWERWRPPNSTKEPEPRAPNIPLSHGGIMLHHSTAPEGATMRMHREFFEDTVGPMADIAFVGCCVTDAAEPPLPSSGATPRRQVVVGSRRVKTVDVHAHCAVPEAMALMGSRVPSEGLHLGAERLRAMDAQGIDVEALSINPYWYTADRD